MEVNSAAGSTRGGGSETAVAGFPLEELDEAGLLGFAALYTGRGFGRGRGLAVPAGSPFKDEDAEVADSTASFLVNMALGPGRPRSGREVDEVDG